MSINIVTYLKIFFKDEQEAAIPNLGVFYISQQPDPHTGSSMPTILFKEKAPRSKAFVNYIAFEEGITEGEALVAVEAWVSGILDKLKTIGVATINELGTFNIIDNKVQFRPAANQNLSHDSYGLEADANLVKEVEKTVEKETEKVSRPKPVNVFEKVEPKEEHKNNKTEGSNKTIIWISIFVVVILAFAGAAVTYQKVPSVRNKIDAICGDFVGKKATEPIVITPMTEVEDTIIEPAKVVETEVKISEISSEGITKTSAKTPSTSITGRFYVIGGAFSVKENAEKFNKKMLAKGYNTKIIFNDTRKYYMVSLGDFSNRQESLKLRDNITYGEKLPCWIYTK